MADGEVSRPSGVVIHEARSDAIYYTTDYGTGPDDFGMFKLYKDNRDISDTRREKIRNSFEKAGYIPVPIVVNEDYYVIDGQGRLAVAKELGIPIAYMIVPKIGMDACIEMNVCTTAWDDWAYIESYAHRGEESYKRIVQLRDQYPWATLSNILMATTGLMRSNDNLRSGHLHVTDDHRLYAIELLSYVGAIRESLDGSDAKKDMDKVANIVMFTYQIDGVDHNRLRRTVEHNVRKIAKYRKSKDQLRELYDRYYKGAPRKGRIHFDNEYEDVKSYKDSWYGKRWGWSGKSDIKASGVVYEAQTKLPGLDD